MQTATTPKVVNALSPARRVPDMRNAAVNTNFGANPVRPLYERLHRPTTSRTRLAATSVVAKQNKSAPRVLASRTTSRASAPRVPKLLARARADYKQDGDGKIGRTRIPGPTVSAVKEANVRRQSMFWARMASVVVRRPERVLAVDPGEETKGLEEELFEEFERPTIESEEPQSEFNEPMDNDIDNTSLMFNDNSFDESVNPDQQSSALNLFGRKMVSMKQLGLGLRTNRDWFVGLARGPNYTGELVGLPRVRPRTAMSVESDLPQHDEIEGMSDEPRWASPRLTQVSISALAAVKPSKKVPLSLLPVIKPATVAVVKRSRREAISTSTSSGIAPKSTKQQMAKSKTKLALWLNRNPAVPKARESVALVAALRKAPLKRRSFCSTASNKSKNASKPHSASKLVPISLSKRRASRPNTKRPARKSDARPPSKDNAALRSSMRKPNSKANKKHVCFVEGPVEPHFYNVRDAVKHSAIAANGSKGSFYWEPMTGVVQSQSSCQGNGTTQLFEGTAHGALTLKRRFLNRYASVQQYETRRRQEASARGEQPTLGQLEYGNADFKIALQPSNVITAHDIGMLQGLSAIGKAGKVRGSYQATMVPVLIFGMFKEPFQNAIIPAKGVKPYKKPLRWPATGSETRLEKFVEQHMKCLQAGDLSV